MGELGVSERWVRIAVRLSVVGLSFAILRESFVMKCWEYRVCDLMKDRKDLDRLKLYSDFGKVVRPPPPEILQGS